MRIALAALLLTGCASPALMQAQAACQSGDMYACDAVLAHERFVADMIVGPPVQPAPPVIWPMMATGRDTTSCRPDYFGGFVCDSY